MSRESCSFIPAVVTRTQIKTGHTHPTSLFQWREGPMFPRCELSPKSASASVGGVVRGPQGPVAVQTLPALWPHAA
jgi:hypothetical protein